MERSGFPDQRTGALWIERHGQDGVGLFRLPSSGRRLQGMTARMVETLCHPAVSDWLKRTMITAVDRDSLDAARDAQLLAELLTERFDRIGADALVRQATRRKQED